MMNGPRRILMFTAYSAICSHLARCFMPSVLAAFVSVLWCEDSFMPSVLAAFVSVLWCEDSFMLSYLAAFVSVLWYKDSVAELVQSPRGVAEFKIMLSCLWLNVLPWLLVKKRLICTDTNFVSSDMYLYDVLWGRKSVATHVIIVWSCVKY